MAGFRLEPGRAAGPTAAWERGRRPRSSRAARAAWRGFIPPPGPPTTARRLGAPFSWLPRLLPPPAAANIRSPLKFTFFEVHAPLGQGSFSFSIFFLIKKILRRNNGWGEGSAAKHLIPLFLFLYLWYLKWRPLKKGNIVEIWNITFFQLNGTNSSFPFPGYTGRPWRTGV